MYRHEYKPVGPMLTMMSRDAVCLIIHMFGLKMSLGLWHLNHPPWMKGL